MTIFRLCHHCNKNFYVSLKSKSQIFCGIKCYKEHISKERKYKCLQCDTEFISKENRRFCSKSCAAKHNNKFRSAESRLKQKETLLSTLEAKPKLPPKPKKPKLIKPKLITERRKKHGLIKDPKIGPNSRIYILKCSHSGELFVSRTITKYSPTYRHLYSREGKAVYKFTFNIYEYPDLFDLSLIEKYGWYSVGGKSKKPINKYGCSRDHKVSINDAISNGYDPYYIKHPLNCDLMLHADNKKKHYRSSISYEDLVIAVDEYDFKKWRSERDSNSRYPLPGTAV